jgi:hypothetical protein
MALSLNREPLASSKPIPLLTGYKRQTRPCLGTYN